jgi:hypothetical protein
MSCVCSCGFDYSAFVEKHQIPPGARIECPECQCSVEIPSADGGLGEPARVTPGALARWGGS